MISMSPLLHLHSIDGLVLWVTLFLKLIFLL